MRSWYDFDTGAPLGSSQGGGLSEASALPACCGCGAASGYSNEILADDFVARRSARSFLAGSGGVDGPVGVVITPNDEVSAAAVLDPRNPAALEHADRPVRAGRLGRAGT